MENLSFIISGGRRHEGHTLANVHTPNPNSLKTVPFWISYPSRRPISIGKHALSGDREREGEVTARESSEMRDKSTRWREKKGGESE